MRLHHIALAVKDIDAARLLWGRLLGKTFSPVKKVESQDVFVSFCEVGDCSLELVQAADTQSPRFPMLPHPVLAFIEKRGEGLHHVAFSSEQLYEDVKKLQTRGIRLLSERPETGAEGKIVFLNPEDCGGVLVELCEANND